METKLERAIAYAEEKHRKQKRELGDPYITHPMAVLRLIARITKDEDVLCAAVLHDVIEDCHVKPLELTELFGDRVTAIVVELSKNHTKVTEIKDPMALLIKMADRLHNLRGKTELFFTV